MGESNSPVFTYDVPASMQKRATDDGVITITSISIRELAPVDEMAATTRARGDAIRLAFELAFESFVGINGKVLSNINGEKERMWRYLGSALRNLVTTGYAQQFMASPEESSAFLQSRKVSV